MKAVKFLIHSKIYIALAAVLLSFTTPIQLGNPPQFSIYLVLIFIATLLMYNLNRVIEFLQLKENIRNQAYYYFSTIIFVGFSVFYLVKFNPGKFAIPIIVPTIFISLFYALPIVKTDKIDFSLREIPYLKVFLISAVWACTTVLIPAFYFQVENANNNTIWFLFVERYLFILAITLPFDIRDIDVDKKNGIKTLPMLFGIKKSIQISIIALSFLIVLSSIRCLNDSNWQLLLVLWISYFSTIYIFNSKNLKRLPLYYNGILDGTMILQGGLIFLSNLF